MDGPQSIGPQITERSAEKGTRLARKAQKDKVMTMDEILELERAHERQMFEHRMQTARYEATSKAINDVIQTAFMLQNAQLTAFMYASLNPNFCRPEAP